MEIRKYIYLAILPLLAACNSQLSPAGYINFIRDADNGFVREVKAGEWQYKAQYKPAAYIYVQENNGKNITESGFEQRKTALKDWYFFNLYVSNTNNHKSAPIRIISSNLDEYNRALSYYLNENRNNFRLYDGQDTLYPVICTYENNYNLSPEDVFVVGFERKHEAGQKKNKMLTLEYSDEVLRTGILKFSFDEKNLAKEPQIKF